MQRAHAPEDTFIIGCSSQFPHLVISLGDICRSLLFGSSPSPLTLEVSLLNSSSKHMARFSCGVFGESCKPHPQWSRYFSGETVIDVTRICVNQRNGIICSFPDTVQTALGNNQKGRNGSVLNILSGQSIP